MDKLLSIREKKVVQVRLPLAIETEPKTSYDNASYCSMVEEFRTWLNDGVADSGFVSGGTGSGITTLLKSVLKESDIDPHHVDHMAKNFTELLEDSSKITRSVQGKKIVVVIDGVDSSAVGKRLLGIISEHVKNDGKHKIICVGHREKKSTSNDFAKKWAIFDIPTPGDDVIFEKLKNISQGRVSDAVVAKIVKQTPSGDIRSCINSLEMQILNPTEKIDSVDTFVDGMDGIEYIFQNDENSFEKLFKIFEQEPWMIKNGAFENYLKFFTSINVVARIAESMSISDSLFDYPDMEMTYPECAFTVGDIKLATKTKKAAITKFGTMWSKTNYQKINAKKHKNIAEKMREQGSLDMPSVDLDYLRNIVRNDYTEEVISEPEYLQLYRTGFRPYQHNKKLFKNVKE
jgi:hypothetical protein